MDELIVRVAASETFREALMHGMRAELVVDSAILIVTLSFDKWRVSRGFSEYFSDGMIEHTLKGAYKGIAEAAKTGEIERGD